MYKVIEYDGFDEWIDTFKTIEECNSLAYRIFESLILTEKYNNRIYVSNFSEDKIIGFDSFELMNIYDNDLENYKNKESIYLKSLKLI